MSLVEFPTDRDCNPVEVIEHIAAINDWSFERSGEDEITIAVGGSWSDYHISFSWMEDVEAMHLACAFDLKVPGGRNAEVVRLLSMINEQLWIGHFDLWEQQGALMYRHTQLLSGGADPNGEQVAAMLSAAVEACERYYQAFQFVIWAGKPAAEALDVTLFETVGVA